MKQETSTVSKTSEFDPTLQIHMATDGSGGHFTNQEGVRDVLISLCPDTEIRAKVKAEYNRMFNEYSPY